MMPTYRPVPLTAVKAGITRMRVKGSANPNTLFDLLNGKVTESGSVKIREGSLIDAKLPNSDCKGLMAWHGKLIFFSHTAQTPPSSKYVCYVLVNPFNPGDKIEKIHFSTPYVGAPYVVAEFEDGTVRHFWLEEATTWTANTKFDDGDFAQPTVPNGYAYKATRLGDAYPAWSPNVVRAVGDKIEPTTYNGFYYEVTAISGTNPRSGTTEPSWPIRDGETVFEDTDSNATAGGGSTTTPPSSGGSGGGSSGDPYCVEENSWLTTALQARYARAGDHLEAHTPAMGYHMGRIAKVGGRQYVQCVRIITETASLVVSCSTPVNHFNATADLGPGTWSKAPMLLGKIIRVEDHAELVVRVEDVGYRWVIPIDANDVSFPASEQREGPRIYTHNVIFFKDEEVP